MIRPIQKEQLPICLDILKKSYEKTAVTFGMTEENCPYRGRTRLPLQVLQEEFENGQMYGYLLEDQIIGFLSLQQKDDGLYIQDIAVLPEYQNNGYGSKLFAFAKEAAQNAGCEKISLGMVYDNLPLRDWYQRLGFKPVQLLHFEKVTYTVAIMELSL